MQQNGRVKMLKWLTEIRQVVILQEERSFQPLIQKSLYQMWAIEKVKMHKSYENFLLDQSYQNEL